MCHLRLACHNGTTRRAWAAMACALSLLVGEKEGLRRQRIHSSTLMAGSGLAAFSSARCTSVRDIKADLDLGKAAHDSTVLNPLRSGSFPQPHHHLMQAPPNLALCHHLPSILLQSTNS